jgi:hypothetical protein
VVVITEERLTPALAAMVGVCLGFAIASKHSFVLSAAVVAFAFAHSARRHARPGMVVLFAVGAMSVLALPQLLRNAVMYGDPLTPVLERFRPSPDPSVVSFADYLGGYGIQANTVLDRARAAFGIIVPPSPGQLSTALGIGSLAILLVRPSNAAAMKLGLAAVGAAAATATLGQLTGRFFLEPYFWAGAACIASASDRWKSLFTGTLALQGFVVALATLVGAVNLVPGALTADLRQQVMTKAANGYAEAGWLDRIAPEPSVIATLMRSRALIPRPFVVADPNVHAPEDLAFMRSLHPGNVLVMPVTQLPEALRDISRCRPTQLGSATFREAVRNPFNRGQEYHVAAILIDRPIACAARLSERAR